MNCLRCLWKLKTRGGSIMKYIILPIYKLLYSLLITIGWLFCTTISQSLYFMWNLNMENYEYKFKPDVYTFFTSAYTDGKRSNWGKAKISTEWITYK